MFTNTYIAIMTLNVLVALNMIFIIVLYGVKLRKVRRQKIKDRFQEKCKEYLVYIQASLESEEGLRIPPFRMNRIEANALQERINEMIEALAGEQREKLIELCRSLGFINYHLRRLHSRSYRSKIDAAYHLCNCQLKTPPHEHLNLPHL